MEDEKRLWKNLKQMLSGEMPEDKEHIRKSLAYVVTECGKEKFFEENEVRMIKNILKYGEKNARDIMTHRKDIIAIDGNETLEQALAFMLKERYSRFPVYADGIDDIIGTIHLREVVKSYLNPNLHNVKIKDLKDCLRTVSFIPETKGLSRLFKQMNTEKNHLFIVLDEYGQTAGIVAMEDIIEEIVGNIFDEYDVEETLITKQADGGYLVRGKTNLQELSELLGIAFEDEEYETLNGFLISKLERIPSEGEHSEIFHESYRFRVLLVDNNVIELVKVEKLKESC